MTDQLRVLREEFANDPNNLETFNALKTRHWQKGDWQAVIKLHEEASLNGEEIQSFEALAEELKTFAEALEAGEEKGAVLLALGDLYHQRLSSHDEAMNAYQAAFKANKEDLAPLQKAAAIYFRRGDWDHLLVILQLKRRVAADAAKQTKEILRIAQVQGDYLRDFDEALSTLDAVEEGGQKSSFIADLRALYQAKTTVEEAIRNALSRAESALNNGPPEEASAAFIEAAHLEYERYQGDPAEALNLAKRALEANPEDEDAQLIVQVLSEEVEAQEAEDGPTAAVSTPEEATEINTEDEPEQEEAELVEVAPATGPRTVQQFYDSLPDFEGDLDAAQEALASQRGDIIALKAVRQHLLDAKDMAGLAELLEGSVRYLRKKDGEWEVMTELANLYWLELGDDEQAEYYFKRLKLLDAEHPDVYKFYEAYFESQGEWRKLYSLMAAHLETIDDREEYRDIAERLAEIADVELNHPEMAIDVWKNFLRQFEDDQDGRQRLRHLYEDHGKWNALVDLFKEEIRQLSEAEDENATEQIRLLEEMAHVYRAHLNLDTMVMNIMTQILELDPDHPSAFAELRELYESSRRNNDLAALLADAADRALESDNQGMAVGYLLEVAEIWEERIGNQTQAIPFLERIIEIAPEEVGVRDRLREIYEKRRDFVSLFDLRLGEARLMGAAQAQEELGELLELARQRLRDPEREANVLTALVDGDPENAELLAQLQEVLESLKEWQRVAEVLEQRAELATDDEAAQLLAKAAQLSLLELDDSQQAARLWRAVLGKNPDHEQAFWALAQILEEQRDYQGLQDLYLQKNKATQLFDRLDELAQTQAEDAVALQHQRSTLASEVLNDPDSVIDALESLTLLLDDPEPVQRELLQWYDQIGDLLREIETRTALVENTSDESARFDEILIIADLEDRREQPDLALGWALQAFTLRPGDQGVLARAEELARRCDMLDAFVQNALTLADGLQGEEEREQIWAAAARIYWQDLQNFEEAIRLFEILRERHPEELDVLKALDDLYDQSGEPQKRIQVLQQQIHILTEEGAADVDLADQLAKIADVQRTHLDQIDDARQTYSQILDLQPDHLGAIRGLKELHRLDEQWMDVVDYLLREIPLAGFDSQEAQWKAKFELAELYRYRLDDLFEALRYYGEILGENPEFQPAMQAVRELLAEDELARDAALLLEPILRDLQQSAPLAEALEARLRICDDPFEEQEILDELIPLYADDLDDKSTAFEYARRQFEIDPERDDIWLRFEQLGAKLNRWEIIEELFTLQSPLEGHDSPTRYDLLRHLAAIREHQLQQTDRALEAWERLHEYDPLDLPTLEALERLYRKTAEFESLVRIIRARAQLVELDEDRIALFVEAGHLLANELQDDPEATELFQLVLSYEPDHEEAIEQLEVLLRRQERWFDLDELLSEQSNQTIDPERRRYFLKNLASVRYEYLGDLPGAVAIISQLLEDDPGDDEVLNFARTVDKSLAEDDSQLQLRLELSQTLEPIYRLRGEYGRLDQVLQVRLMAGASDFERIEILDELVDLRQKRLSDPSGAMDALGEAVIAQPDDESRRQKLLELAIGVDRLEEGIAILEEAALNTDPITAIPIWKRLGLLAAQKLGELERAIDYYERALELDETDTATLEALERLFETTNQPDKLCQNLNDQARFADPDRRLKLLRRIAMLYEQILDEPVEAIDAYGQILEMEPDDLQAIEALEHLYRSEEQYFELVELWRRKVDLLDSSSQRLALLQEWATVAEDELADLEQTKEIYFQMLQEEPGYPKALAQLDRILSEELQWADWTEIARQRLEGPALTEPELRLELQLRLARALNEELFEVEEALKVYREILSRTPDQADAIIAIEELARQEEWLEELADDLERVYRDQQRFDDLLDLVERRRDQALDPFVKAELFFESGRILRDHLERVEEALRCFAESWKLNIEEKRYREALIRLATNEERWELLIELLSEILEVVVDPALSQELHLILASLWQEMLQEPLEAEAHYREVLNASPDHRGAYQAVREMLLEQGRWHDLIDLLEERYTVIVDDDEQEGVQLLLRVADLQAEELSDGFTAVETLNRVLAIDERQPEALKRIEALLKDQERWEELALFYEDRAAQTSLPSEILKAELAIAELCRGPLLQIERAIELYGKALQINAEHEGAIAALEEIFAAEEDHRVQAGEYLEYLYRTRQNYHGLAKILDARALASQDPEVVHRSLRELADLLQDFVDDPAWSWAVLARLLAIDPYDGLTRQRLWNLTARATAWEELASVYAAILQENFELDDQQRAQLHIDRALIFADRLADLPRGREAAEQALAMAPDSPEAIDLMERILERQGAWLDLAEFYRNRADFDADEGQKRIWYEQLATLYEDVLNDVDATVDVYAQLLELVPGEEEYRRAMERILGAVGRWYDLADIYRQRIAGALDPDVVLENKFALAQLLEGELDSPFEAIELYQEILEENHNFSEAIRALEGIRRDLAGREGEWAHMRQTTIELLLKYYEEERNWQRIDDLLEELTALVDDPQEQVDLLIKKARRLLKASDDSTEKVQALTNLAQAYCLDPTNEEVSQLIEALANDLDAWKRVVPIYLHALGESDDVDRQGHILAAIAQIYEGPIGDIESAIAAYQQSVEISVESEIALEKLQELYGAMEKWRPLVQILEKRLEVEYDPEMQQTLRKRIARIYDETLQEAPAAISLYEEIRREEPEELAHLVVLERLYETVEDFQSLEELLIDKLQILDAEALQARAHKKLAVIRRDKLENFDDAILSFHDALLIAPDDLESVDALIDLYRQEERWPELLDILQTRRELAEDDYEINEYDVQIGDLLQEKMDDPFGALERYREVLEREPENYLARGALFRALTNPDLRTDAAELLVQAHRQGEEWDDLEALYERLIELSIEDRPYLAEQYLALASLQTTYFDLPVKAFATLSRAMRHVPENQAVREELERLAHEVGFTDDLIAIYDEALQTEIDDPEVRRSLHLAVARGFLTELEEPEKAIPHFEAVLEMDEYDREALDGLDTIYQALRDWENLHKILENKLPIVSGDDELQVRFQLGYLREVVFEDNPGALEMYRHVLLEVPNHTGSIEGLERLCEDRALRAEILELLEPTYRDEQEWAKLVRLFELKLEDVEDPAGQADLLRQMAVLQLEELDDSEGAFLNWGRALRQDPHDMEVQERLESLTASLDRYQDLVPLYDEIAADLGDPIRKVELAEKAGRWALERLGQTAQAAALFRQVLSVEPEHQEALEILENIARVEGDEESLAAVLAARVQSTFEPEEQIALYTELATVRLSLQDYQGAIEAFQQLLILDEETLERLETLAQLFEITEQWQERADILERLLIYRDDQDGRFVLYTEIGTIALEKLEDFSRARFALEEALTLVPGNAEILRALEDVYEGAKDWQALGELLDQKLETTEDDRERLRLLVRRAQVRYEVSKDIEGAIADYQQAFAIQADHPEIIAALGELYRSERRWADLLDLLQVQIDDSTDHERASAYLLEMAIIAQDELQELDSAMEYATAALERDAQNSAALDRLESIQRARRDWEALVAIIDRRLEQAEDEEQELALLKERARTLEDDKKDLAAAAETYLELLKRSPQDKTLLNKLESLYEAERDGEGLYVLLELQVQQAPPEQKAELYLEMGEVARRYLGGGELRIQALEEARNLRGNDDLEVVEPLLDAYIEGERFDMAEPLLADVIDSLTQARMMKDVVRFYHLRGKLAEQQGQIEAAKSAYEEAHRLDATFIPNLLSLGKLAINTQDWELAKKTFQILLLHQMNIKNNEDKVAVYYNLATIREFEGDERGARDMYKRALRVDPEHQDSMAALAALDA